MIEVAPDTIILLYLAGTLSILLALWLYQSYRSGHHKLNLAKQKLVVCEYCQFAYLANRGDTISKCPQCTSLSQHKNGTNKKQKRS